MGGGTIPLNIKQKYEYIIPQKTREKAKPIFVSFP